MLKLDLIYQIQTIGYILFRFTINDFFSTLTRIKEALWPDLSGTEHNALINFFLLLKGVDEKAPISGLTAAEHVKLLKKAKAASTGKLITSSEQV